MNTIYFGYFSHISANTGVHVYPLPIRPIPFIWERSFSEPTPYFGRESRAIFHDIQVIFTHTLDAFDGIEGFVVEGLYFFYVGL